MKVDYKLSYNPFVGWIVKKYIEGCFVLQKTFPAKSLALEYIEINRRKL